MVPSNSARSAGDTVAVNIGSKLELFVDRHLVDRLRDARLEMHTPTPREVAIRFDNAWDWVSGNYTTVMKDDDRYRMYYRASNDGFPGKPSEKTGEVICYAESSDGITWTKPALGVCTWRGTAENNIVWTGPITHCMMVVKDANPAAAAEERYKALAIMHTFRPLKQVFALSSPDGIHWKKMREEPIITQPNTDQGQDLALWDTEQRQYVAYLRAWRSQAGTKAVPIDAAWDAGNRQAMSSEGEVFRQVARCTSPDFLHWTEPEFIDLGDAPLEHFYTFSATPYFRAPHIYLAFPRRFVIQRTKYKEHPRPGVSDVVFLSSRDGVRFDRTFMEAFKRPGTDPKNWTDRNGTPVWGVVPTGPAEISLYIDENLRYVPHRLRRYTLRTDGFVSVKAGYAGGEMVTKPLVFEGRELVINYATSAAGSVKVEVQDAAGQPIPGYTLGDSEELFGDEIEHAVAWKGGADLGRLAGVPVRLRFVLRDADLFSLRFRPLE